MARNLELYASRSDDFEVTLHRAYRGPPLPLSGATISMQVRMHAHPTGAPLLQLASINFIDTDHPTNAGQRLLSVYPRIAQPLLVGLPTGLNQPEPGEADRYFHEIKIHYADAKRESLWVGPFLLQPGVNDL